MISLSDPVLGEEEKEALCSVINSGWITMGERIADFERAFAKAHKVKNAVAVNSCTAGLHLCLAALDLDAGDEVLVPSLTFVASVNAVLYVGAKPVFVDIDANERPHISLEDAAGKCTSKTRAIIVMHYGGYLVDLPAWRSFADAHGLKLIEDSAHAPATGQVGRLSDAACFSFFSNKNMTTAEGGMVISSHRSLLERVRRMRSHGMTTDTVERHKGHAYSYDVTTLGYNYRMDELRAAMGLVQLDRLPKWNRRRRILTDYYREMLEKQLPDVSVPFDKGHETAAHLMPVLLPEGVDREKIMIRLRQENIQSSIHYPSVHQFSYYLERFPGVSLPNTEQFAARELTLPLHPELNESEVERVVNVLSDSIYENV
jgi:dTDP-4-amino-4,6-dideoxygalactose transaminase